jgi:hypothetical protein
LLIGAGRLAYFGCGSWSSSSDSWDDRWFEEFSRPLGPPVADAVKDNSTGVWTRSFDGVHGRTNVSWSASTGGSIQWAGFAPPPPPLHHSRRGSARRSRRTVPWTESLVDRLGSALRDGSTAVISATNTLGPPARTHAQLIAGPQYRETAARCTQVMLRWLAAVLRVAFAGKWRDNTSDTHSPPFGSIPPM